MPGQRSRHGLDRVRSRRGASGDDQQPYVAIDVHAGDGVVVLDVNVRRQSVLFEPAFGLVLSDDERLAAPGFEPALQDVAPQRVQMFLVAELVG